MSREARPGGGTGERRGPHPGGGGTDASRAAWWAEVRSRLSAAAAREQASRVDALLERRARELAAPLPTERGSAERRDHLVVTVAGGRFALPAGRVDGVAPARRVTRLPGAPPFVLGLSHHRGDVVAVLDAARLLGAPGEAAREGGFLVLLRDEGARFALAVDGVAGVETVAGEEVRPVPAGSGWEVAYVAGVAPGGLAVVDVERLLADEGLVVRQDPSRSALEEQ